MNSYLSLTRLAACGLLALVSSSANAEDGIWYNHRGEPVTPARTVPASVAAEAAAGEPEIVPVKIAPAIPSAPTDIRVGSAGHAPTQPSKKAEKVEAPVAPALPVAVGPAPIVPSQPALGSALGSTTIQVFQPRTQTTSRRYSNYPTIHEAYGRYGYSYGTSIGYRSYPTYGGGYSNYGRCYTPSPCSTPIYSPAPCGPTIHASGRIGNLGLSIRTGR